jgi:hypothetical protein
MNINKDAVQISTFIYATSVSETERLYTVPLKLAAQDYEFEAGISYAVTVDLLVEGTAYSLDASICSEGYHPELSLETYTSTCVQNDGDVISVTYSPDGKTLIFTSPEAGPLRSHWFDGTYSLSIPHEYEENKMVVGNCHIRKLA